MTGEDEPAGGLGPPREHGPDPRADRGRLVGAEGWANSEVGRIFVLTVELEANSNTTLVNLFRGFLQTFGIWQRLLDNL